MNTVTGIPNSSFNLLIRRLVDLVGCPDRWMSVHPYLSGNPFSISLAYIPPVSMAITNLVFPGSIWKVSCSTLYGTEKPVSATSSMQLIVFMPFLVMVVKLMSPYTWELPSSGLSLKSSLIQWVTVSRSSANRLLSSWLWNLALFHPSEM